MVPKMSYYRPRLLDTEAASWVSDNLKSSKLESISEFL